MLILKCQYLHGYFTLLALTVVFYDNDYKLYLCICN